MEPRATGGRRIRLLFTDTCPTVFLRAAVRSLPAPYAVEVEVAAGTY